MNTVTCSEWVRTSLLSLYLPEIKSCEDKTKVGQNRRVACSPPSSSREAANEHSVSVAVRGVNNVAQHQSPNSNVLHSMTV